MPERMPEEFTAAAGLLMRMGRDAIAGAFGAGAHPQQ